MIERPTLDNATILLVEDDESLKGLLHKYLDRHRSRVLVADDGEEAWRLFQEHDVDVIISDWMMPRMDGRELLGRVQSTRRGRGIPFLFLTAKDKLEDLVEALGSGASEYMTKPFHMTELLARVQTLLRMKRLQDDLRREKVRLEDELALAQRVQSALMARRGDPPPNLEVLVHYQPSNFVSGDFFDLLHVGEGNYGLFIGDVTGRGPAAALITSLVKGLLSRLAPGIHDPARVLQTLNDHLVEVLEPQMYVSAFYGIFHSGRRTLRFSNGGQNRQIRLAGADRAPRPLYIDGALVGLFPGQAYEQAQIELEPGDRILLFTDGVYEAAGVKGEYEGFEWLQQTAREHAFDPLDQFLLSFLPRPEVPGGIPDLEDDLLAAALEVRE